MTWLMPSETAPQKQVWMAFPPARTHLDDPAEHERALTAWAAVANAIVRFEPVTIVVNTGETAGARPRLDDAITIIEAPLDDAWMRDIGPTFVLNASGDVGAVDWKFNGWGQQDWAEWEHDSAIGSYVAGQSGAALIGSPIVNEGGGIAVDGLGTVIVTETVQLDPYRNPTLGKPEIEAELARTIGATHVIWLPRGLTRDAERFGTRGHVDIVAAIPSPGVLLVHSQQNPEHPDHAVTRDAIAVLRATTDAAGTPWQIIEVPAPTTLRDDEGWVDYSYINHLVINGAVIACSFDDPADDTARHILAAAYPGREIVTVDARAIFARGGGIHCITQNEPAGRA